MFDRGHFLEIEAEVYQAVVGSPVPLNFRGFLFVVFPSLELLASLVLASEAHLDEPPHASRGHAVVVHVLRLHKAMRKSVILHEPIHLFLDSPDGLSPKDGVSVSVHSLWTRQEAVDHAEFPFVDFPPSCAHC